MTRSSDPQMDQLYADWLNQRRAERRRELYRSDPLWRLSKLKDSRERRARARMEASAS